MPSLLLYLLQVNLGLVLLYLLYQVALRQTTFYTWNRWFLLAGLVFCVGFPLVDFSFLMPQKPQLYQTLSMYSYSWQYAQVQDRAAAGFDFWQIPVAIFWLGLGVMSVRLCVQLASLYSIHRRSRKSSFQGIPFRDVPQDFPPFSFLNTIYFNAQRHPQEDWLPILKHEHTHVRQAHTVDILLVELLTLGHWFNPVIWLLRKALKQNLEFLTDQQTVGAGIDRKRYQFSLLQTAGASPFSLSASFSYHSLKHRIMMMNKTPSARWQRVRFLAAAPLLLLSLFACQTIGEMTPETDKASLAEIEVQGKPMISQDSTSKTVPPPPPPFYDAPKEFTARNPSVKGLSFDGEHQYVFLKSGEVEKFPSTQAGRATFEKKYGILPPPPPPVRVQGKSVPPAPLAPPPPPPPYRKDWPKDFLARNPSVEGFTSSDKTFYVILKNGEVESFDHSPEGVAALEKKYGPLPAPPPPVRKKAATSTLKFQPPVLEKDAPAQVNPQQLPQDYKDFLRRNPAVSHIYYTENSFHVVLKSGGSQAFPSSDAGYKAAEKKFGKLPAAPAMPPLYETPIPKLAPKKQ